MVDLSQCQQSSWPSVLNLKALLKYWSRLLVRYLLEIVTNVRPQKNLVRVRLDWKCCHISVGAAQLSHSIPNRDQIYLRGLVEYFFFTFQSLSQWRNVASLSLLYHYCHGKCSDELITFFLPVQTFTAWERHATFTDFNHFHFIYIPKFNSDSFIKNTISFGINDLSLNATSLTPSCQGTLVTLNPYFHNLPFLPPPILYISHTSFSNSQ